MPWILDVTVSTFFAKFQLICIIFGEYWRVHSIWYKNGTIITNTALSITANKEYFFGGRVYTNATGWEFNFGSPAYAISSGNADGNGYGNFEYAVPSGYYSLNTKNLAEYG